MADKTVTVKQSGGTYTTFQGAITGEVAANADLTALGNLTISIEGDWNGVPDTSAVIINGFTMDLTHRLKVVTDAANRARKSGIDTTRYVLQVTDAFCVTLSDNYIWIDGLQMNELYSATINRGCIIDSSIAAANLLKVSNCYLRAAAATGRGIQLSDSSDILKVWNCVIVAGQLGIRIYYSTTDDIYNCIVYGGSSGGISVDAGPTVTVENCVVMATADDFLGTMTLLTCASDDNDAGADLAHDADWGDDFVNAAGGDFTLKAGSQLIGAGTVDPGSGLFSDDIDGDARGVAWDVGADEYVAAAAGGHPAMKRFGGVPHVAVNRGVW